MTVQFYPNGAGGTLGDQADTCKPLSLTGNIWYVSFATGIDAASPAGQNREKPVKTLAQAITNSAAGDMIVCLAGHAETLTAGVSLKAYQILVGEGYADGKPSVSFRAGAAGIALINVAGAVGVEVRNIYFPEAAVSLALAFSKLSTGSGSRVIGCYFEQGANDLGPACSPGTANTRYEGCTWISTATLSTAQPLAAIKLGAATFDQLEMYNCIVSAGTVGFSNYAALDFSTGSLTNCRIFGLSLLLGADIAMGASATGMVNPQLANGGSRVGWS